MRKNENKLSKELTGVAGEYFVAGELSKRGYLASITLRNSESIDIHASCIENDKIFAIQVKTNQNSSRKWPVGQKAEKLKSNKLFYIFVSLNKLNERPNYFIVPSKAVAKFVTNSHKKWLESLGKDGKLHRDNSIRQFSDKDGIFLERWDLLN